jgi:hypothetical protein
LEQSEELKQYKFSPRVGKKSIELVQKQVHENKWGDIKTVFDHLTKDTELRE